MPFKSTALAFAASLAAHALLVTFYLPVLENRESDSHSVDISYVHYAKETPQAVPTIKYPPVAKNYSRVQMSKPETIRSSRVKENSREGSAAAALPAAHSFRVRNSEEFLTNPQKGKVFLNYFGLIKQRVRRAVEKKYSSERLGRGDVSLLFVLKADGTVVNIIAVKKDSSADEVMTDFAIRCVKDCSPFPHFPKELGMERISFNLSILFDETT